MQDEEEAERQAGHQEEQATEGPRKPASEKAEPVNKTEPGPSEVSLHDIAEDVDWGDRDSDRQWSGLA